MSIELVMPSNHLIRCHPFLLHTQVCVSKRYRRFVVQSLSRVRLFVTPWTAARQASLSIINSWSLFKLMSIESVIPSNHLDLCRPLLLLPSIFLSIRVFTNVSAVHFRWPKYWSFSFSPSNDIQDLFPLTSLISLQCKRFSRIFYSS